jgi:hypothetical protein
VNGSVADRVTEWKPFCYPDITAMKNLMRQHIIFDGRNQYDPAHIRGAGFVYYGIGRGEVPKKNTIENYKNDTRNTLENAVI